MISASLTAKIVPLSSVFLPDAHTFSSRQISILHSGPYAILNRTLVEKTPSSHRSTQDQLNDTKVLSEVRQRNANLNPEPVSPIKTERSRPSTLKETEVSKPVGTHSNVEEPSLLFARDAPRRNDGVNRSQISIHRDRRWEAEVENPSIDNSSSSRTAL